MRVLLSVGLCAMVLTASTLHAGSREDIAHLRPQDDRLAQAIRDGSARSSTFKALVDRIQGSQVIVYVALSPVMKSSLSGMLTWMTRAGDFRYVRATISTDLNQDQMIAIVAHELQHAVEVIEDESVNDEKSLVALYRRIGQQNTSPSQTRWETSAAQEAGFQVRRELVGTPASTVARANIGRRS